ncbi:hypothetical protein K466DRAFT_589503 [Polyporus arcularius HHB13444]|uniref:Uncharacterized protein n=1 Tax=Polyporus arcularius HHB13444 TaxID=1314778 RepID=A0A5C3P348_9APHY|nr:hypothetical protein K466DRAFT_589503 [Polyporus arcularius HHB13444]
MPAPSPSWLLLCTAHASASNGRRRRRHRHCLFSACHRMSTSLCISTTPSSVPTHMVAPSGENAKCVPRALPNPVFM